MNKASRKEIKEKIHRNRRKCRKIMNLLKEKKGEYISDCSNFEQLGIVNLKQCNTVAVIDAYLKEHVPETEYPVRHVCNVSLGYRQLFTFYALREIAGKEIHRGKKIAVLEHVPNTAKEFMDYFNNNAIVPYERSDVFWKVECVDVIDVLTGNSLL